MGTIVYVKDELEIEVSPEKYKGLSPEFRYSVEKFSYIDSAGNRVLSWDHGKYVNHCCYSNTLTTGYGFEIAIRDIKEGEQITDDYGLFNLEYEMPLLCKNKSCRKVVRSADFLKNVPYWDDLVKNSLKSFKEVSQPLLSVVPQTELSDLNNFFENVGDYKSVARQQIGENEPSNVTQLFSTSSDKSSYMN